MPGIQENQHDQSAYLARHPCLCLPALHSRPGGQGRRGRPGPRPPQARSGDGRRTAEDLRPHQRRPQQRQGAQRQGDLLLDHQRQLRRLGQGTGGAAGHLRHPPGGDARPDPLVIQDLVDLKPEAIFIGHGHFDHADNAAFISGKTGAIIYASPETCDNMQLDAVKIFGAGASVPCVAVTSRGSIPGSEVIAIRQLEPVATIKAFKHLHSTNTAPQDTSFPPNIIHSPVNGACAVPCNLADPRDPSLFPAGTPLSTILDIATSRAGQGGPISIYYAFKLHDGNQFTFVWHNTSGALREGCALPNNIAGTSPPQPSHPGQNAQGCFG